MAGYSFIQSISLPYQIFFCFNLLTKDDFSNNAIPQFFHYLFDLIKYFQSIHKCPYFILNL